MGRELTFANPKIINLVNTYFVPVAMDDWYQRRRKDREGAFFLHVANQGPRKDEGGTRQGIYALTADGRLLNYRNSQQPDVMQRFLADALQAFREIPPAERARGAMRVEELGPTDKRFAPMLPEGAVIVNTFARILDRKDEFYCHGSCQFPGGQRASHDHMWLRAEECQALMPKEPKKDQVVPVPLNVIYRLARYHLVDNTRGEPPMWKTPEVREFRLKLTVDDVARGEVRMKLTGTFLLSTGPDSRTAKRGFDAAVLGDIRYDPAKRVLTRFDMVAVGAHWGEGAYTGGARAGRQPFGVALELGSPNRPADRVAPQFLREGGNYWNAQRE